MRYRYDTSSKQCLRSGLSKGLRRKTGLAACKTLARAETLKVSVLTRRAAPHRSPRWLSKLPFYLAHQHGCNEAVDALQDELVALTCEEQKPSPFKSYHPAFSSRWRGDTSMHRSASCSRRARSTRAKHFGQLASTRPAGVARYAALASGRGAHAFDGAAEGLRATALDD